MTNQEQNITDRILENGDEAKALSCTTEVKT